jgi:tRNA-Thr(GGU) m(6)t(6)A37 methyltransferase TsaA
MKDLQTFQFEEIGRVRSVFKEKFGIARQSLMLSKAHGVLKLHSDHRFKDAISNLESFSHVWVLFIFHTNLETAWRPIVTPPRVDGPKKVGVFGSRSPYRPNPIGMSVLKIEKIDTTPSDGIEIHVSGLDILDDTPIVDIKPYLPFADRIEEASSGWASSEIKKYPIRLSDAALVTIEAASKEHPGFQDLLLEMIELDPRPISQKREAPMESVKSHGKKFGFRLLNYEIHLTILNHEIHVLDLVRLEKPPTPKHILLQAKKNQSRAQIDGPAA